MLTLETVVNGNNQVEDSINLGKFAFDYMLNRGSSNYELIKMILNGSLIQNAANAYREDRTYLIENGFSQKQIIELGDLVGAARFSYDPSISKNPVEFMLTLKEQLADGYDVANDYETIDREVQNTSKINWKDVGHKVIKIGMVVTGVFGIGYVLLGGVATAEVDAGIKTLYVDDDANGLNNGSSWVDAYNYLQDALIAALSGDEIRVAQGIYKPDQGANQTQGDRTATFQLISGVTLKGGYAGFGAPEPNTRDVKEYETILSGDLNGDDVQVADAEDLLDEPTRADNSYHVVSGNGCDHTAILDGFTITDGNANSSAYPNFNGGGMCNYSGSPTVANCLFIRNCATWAGGGLVNIYSTAILTNCRFIGNAAHHGGGGAGGGGHVEYQNCMFSGNSAITYGGGLENQSSRGVTSFVMLTNCTFSRNLAQEGGALSVYDYANAILTNCILWGDAPMEIYQDSVMNTVVSYSCIEYGWSGTGNIDADPYFADTNDYHLKSQAGRWDPNLMQWTIDDVISPCIDAGDPMSPIMYEPFPNGGMINMGAYGGTPYASKSYFGKPPCETIVAGDINGDCKVDFYDFAIMALHWLENHREYTQPEESYTPKVWDVNDIDAQSNNAPTQMILF